MKGITAAQFLFFLLFSLAHSACAAQPKISSEQLAQTSAASTMANGSPTAIPSATPAPTGTSLPTDTPLPTGTPIPTTTPTPTQDRTATAASQATETAEAAQAAIAPILDKYGLSGEQGSLAWVQKFPVEIHVENYNEWRVAPTTTKMTFTDFAMYYEVTWESRSGLAGCGVAFHSDNTKNDGEQYRFFALRFSGVPAWAVESWKNNQMLSFVTDGTQFHESIDLRQGSTNKYMLVMQDGQLTLYRSEEQMGVVEIPENDGGYLLFLGLQESMSTTCLFENAWIWALK